MPDTNCCRSCSADERARVIDILGKPVRIKDYVCSPDGRTYRKKPEKNSVYLSICPTSLCRGHCAFCVATHTNENRRLNIEAFAGVMKRLKEQDLIHAVKITGGEPFDDVGLLNEVIGVLFETFGFGLTVSISTNAMRLERLHEVKDLSYVETIHVSRHHYDDAVNRAIFGGADVPSGAKLKEIVSAVSFKDLFVFNCMLLKDHINSPEEAHRMLDFAIETGVPKVGFMTCMPVNAYAQQQTIPFESVLNEDDPALLFTRAFYDYEFCHCRDGVYVSPNGSLIEFYGRCTKMDDPGYSRGLVYDADNHLKLGFSGAIIV